MIKLRSRDAYHGAGFFALRHARSELRRRGRDGVEKAGASAGARGMWTVSLLLDLGAPGRGVAAMGPASSTRSAGATSPSSFAGGAGAGAGGAGAAAGAGLFSGVDDSATRPSP